MSLPDILKAWKRYKKDSNNSEEFVFKWCESLLLTCDIYKHDQGITTDLLVCAVNYFNDDLTDSEKRDAFFYLLGLYNRK